MKKIIGAIGAMLLVSCAAEKSQPKVHPTVGFALWNAAKMPAVEGDTWAPYVADENAKEFLRSLSAHAGEFYPHAEAPAYQNPDHLANYFEDFLGTVDSEGTIGQSGGGAGLPVVPSTGSGSLPTTPSTGSGSLPTTPTTGTGALPSTPATGSLSLSPTPAFMTSFGGGGSSSSNFANAFCEFLSVQLTWTRACVGTGVDWGPVEQEFAAIERVCRSIFTEIAGQFVDVAGIPSSVVKGFQCLAREMRNSTNCEISRDADAYAACGLEFAAGN